MPVLPLLLVLRSMYVCVRLLPVPELQKKEKWWCPNCRKDLGIIIGGPTGMSLPGPAAGGAAGAVKKKK